MYPTVNPPPKTHTFSLTLLLNIADGICGHRLVEALTGRDFIQGKRSALFRKTKYIYRLTDKQRKLKNRKHEREIQQVYNTPSCLYIHVLEYQLTSLRHSKSVPVYILGVPMECLWLAIFSMSHIYYSF